MSSRIFPFFLIKEINKTTTKFEMISDVVGIRERVIEGGGPLAC